MRKKEATVRFRVYEVIDSGSVLGLFENPQSGMTGDCVVPSLFVRGQNFLKNVVNLEIRERVKSNKLDSFGQAFRMTNKVNELINLSTYPLIYFNKITHPQPSLT